MTAVDIVVAGATTALARRTTLRKAFLAPWHPLVEQCWLYSLADAQRNTDVAVHHSTLVINHHHTSVTPATDNLPEFKRRFHHDLSCSLNVLLAQERYDAPRELFDDRATHQMRLLDDAAQASHLVYEHLNPVAAGLVQRPEQMPSTTLDFGLWKTGYIEVERPPVYFSTDRPERQKLFLTPPPLLYRAFGGDLDCLIHHMRRLCDDGLRALRGARKRPPMGAKALRRMHPWSEPRTLRERGGESIPTYRVGARGIVGRKMGITAACEVSGFRAAHRGARVARRDGDHEACFPFGTYAMRVHHGVPVEPGPAVGALITQPGPLLSDVKAEFAAAGELPRCTPHQLIDDVRSALTEEAEQIVEHSDLDMLSRGRESSASPASLAGLEPEAQGHTRKDAVVRHRFGARVPGGNEAPRRTVTLRDRRRGRQPRRGPTHGSDPPE